MGKPNCYKCSYREVLPGDAHSRCIHPKVNKKLNNDLIAAMIEAHAGKVIEVRTELGIKEE